MYPCSEQVFLASFLRECKMSVFDQIVVMLSVLAVLGLLLAIIGVFGLTIALAVAAVLYAVKKSDGCKKALIVILKIMGAFLAAGFLCTVIYLIIYLLN